MIVSASDETRKVASHSRNFTSKEVAYPEFPSTKSSSFFAIKLARGKRETNRTIDNSANGLLINHYLWNNPQLKLMKEVMFWGFNL